MVATRAIAAVRAWPHADLRAIRLEEGSDGFHRSWIMLFPEGKYEHETYGELNFDAKTLAEIKRNFDSGAREIEIAIDRDHKATEGDSTAMGWLEGMQIRPQMGETPAGLWGCIRWTDIGLHEIEAQHYRYFSPEFKTEYTNQLTGRQFSNVVIGGALTNRPFLKAMPAIALAEGVSTRPWGDIDKACLPDSAFLDPKNRRLPVYEGTGPKDAAGRYTKRGKLNINGVEAALAAVHGAHTGKSMSGLPAGIASKLQGWIDRYKGGGGGSSASKAASEGGTRHMATTRDGRTIQLLDGNTGAGTDQVSRTHPNTDDDMDVEEYAEDGMDGDMGYDENSDTHGAMTTDGHSHGKYAEHSHDGDGDHSDAPLAEKAKGKKMSEPRTKSEYALRLSEAERRLAEYDRRLYETQVGTTLNALLPEGHKFSRVFATKLREWMVGDGYQLSEGKRSDVLELVKMALSEKAIVDTRKLGSSYDQEVRRTQRTSDPKHQGTADEDLWMETAERIALAEGKIQPGETLATLSLADRERIMKRAFVETEKAIR